MKALSDRLLHPGTAHTAHVETLPTSSAAVKHDQRYVFQSSQVQHQCLLKAQMILLKAELAACASAMNI